MEAVARLLAYPVFEVGMIADQLGSGIAVSIFSILLILGCSLLCINSPWLSKKNTGLILSLFLPFLLWSILFKFSSNSGVGNLIIELCALITVMVSSCIFNKINFIFKVIKIEYLFLLPQSILLVFVVLFRLFMPLIGK